MKLYRMHECIIYKRSETYVQPQHFGDMKIRVGLHIDNYTMVHEIYTYEFE